MSIIEGDAYDALDVLADKSVDVCFTSPNPFAYHDIMVGIGSERTTTDYFSNLIKIFEKVKSTER